MILCYRKQKIDTPPPPKIYNFEEQKKKNVLDIWWIGTGHQNLLSIHLTVSEKTMSTDGRRTDGKRTPTKHKAEVKKVNRKQHMESPVPQPDLTLSDLERAKSRLLRY